MAMYIFAAFSPTGMFTKLQNIAYHTVSILQLLPQLLYPSSSHNFHCSKCLHLFLQKLQKTDAIDKN